MASRDASFPVETAPGTASTPGAGGRSEAGYNMVILMVAVTILTILTAAALPMWSHAMQREKEEELIFRGWQYAEAIRLFQQRQGRYPTRLQELIEVHPRSIRKLWTDPMTENGEWGLVFQGVGATGLPGQAGGAGQTGPNGRPLPGPRAPRGGQQQTVGPITGVHSLSKDEAIKSMFGEDTYDKWLFTVDRLVGGAAGGTNVAGGGGPAQANPRGGQNAPGAQGATSAIGPPPAKWIGRPFRPGLSAPQGGGVPGGPGHQVGTGANGRPVPGSPPGRPGSPGDGSDQ